MEAAKRKVAQLQAEAGAGGASAASVLGAAAGGMGGAQLREWEEANVAKHRAGELNDAELGMAHLKQVHLHGCMCTFE